jgi:ferredoxin/flavodoxin---NADP+ reductase
MSEWPIGSAERPLLVAIVGTGPSGFFAAQALSRVPELHVRLDLFDRLPTPYGLVRAGVAPDHANIKAIAKRFDRVARDERVRFFGNVHVGETVTPADLRSRYDAVIYATGAEVGSRLSIPGEDLDGVVSAAGFVFWYNAHPDQASLRFDLTEVRRVAVLGNGNVALDVARVLARRTEDLHATDIADHALSALRESAIQDVHVYGRRGPAQAAFSWQELRDLTKLDQLALRVAPEDLTLDAATREGLDRDGTPLGVQKTLDLLAGAVEADKPGERAIHFRFFTSPVAFLGDESGRLRGMRLTRNQLVWEGGRLRAKRVGEEWEEPCDMALTAIGYRGVPIPGLPFDDWRGIVPNEAGRISFPEGGDDAEGPGRGPGEYVVGWAKRGPVGVIGTNKPDSQNVVKLLLADLVGKPASARPLPDVTGLLAESGVHGVPWSGWDRIDAAERGSGEGQGRPRVKLATWEGLIDAADE